MSRRASNNIRGPHSALTDFLASNNISAAQIRDDYERRRTAAQQQAEQEVAANGDVVEKKEDGDENEEEERVETAAQKKKRKRQQDKVLAKIKQTKDFRKQKRDKDGEPDGDEDDIAWDMYAKSKPLPGQLEHCELCNKRFTVTPYSKTGPDGGLLCTKCSKEIGDEEKKNKKKQQQATNRGKRRQVQSNLLDGVVRNGSKPLQELCVEKVADNIHDVDEFGDLPNSLLDSLSKILSRRRALTSRTINLFLRSDLDTVSLYDCGKIQTEDYIRIFSVIPTIQNLRLGNAGQFKDEVIDYVIERKVPIKRLHLEAANLVSDEKWREFFFDRGICLESLKLSWLDYSLDNETITYLVQGCPVLKRLKLKKCFRLTECALLALINFQCLEHLSLRLAHPVSAPCIVLLITAIGKNLRTLSLEAFIAADDTILETIHNTCTHLSKLRFTENDSCTDAAFASLFTNWPNPALSFIDFNSCRDIDCAKPEGPDEPVGLADSGFRALMSHSGSKLERLNIASCRHITYKAFSEVFDGKKQYPMLREMDISFQTKVDTSVVAGIFISCPSMKKLTAFGCFNIMDVIVPKGVALIGVPNAQDSIVQEGDAFGGLGALV